MTEPSKPEQSAWMRIVQEDAGHSAAYVQRFRDLAAQGRDLVGEARLVDAMLSRGSRVLDAGCGPGRVGAFLHEVGHDVVGVDADPVLIAAAEEDHPGPRWLVGDLAELDLPAVGITEPFDAIVCAGNVMTFLATSTRGAVLRRLRAPSAGRARGDRVRRRARLRVRRVPRRRPGGRLGAGPAAVHVGPAAVHSRRRLPGRRPPPHLSQGCPSPSQCLSCVARPARGSGGPRDAHGSGAAA
jgi:SAM-dependent methyltransferase